MADSDDLMIYFDEEDAEYRYMKKGPIISLKDGTKIIVLKHCGEFLDSDYVERESFFTLYDLYPEDIEKD